ncbi:S41 family peptidase [Desulfosporosinus sp. BICA1-9]|uniref:S41 family peptidase n=1 Tax=Desulfosporosinus sp. BICA1-9 TaxID=1531958 RepID=UPI00054BBBC9|nr:S41 family peptidase [Desulfosporosinus sp. BICA1-9]KJS47799.1 MAG: peptidase [Peptococcaceae bacterium BRH_c23]KJS89917.1 MAG: peptidase [Desulfosporosinus sp. BICA1-9]HBW35094.1 S41 family peptidase [Desulfosporosinus sp.]
MHAKFLRTKVVGHIFLNIVLVLILILNNSALVLASDVGVLKEIRLLLKDQYVDPVSADVLNAPTVDEMLKRLGDPYTMYLSPEEYQGFIESIDMRFSGIGINIEIVPEGVKVLSVISGSPAEEVGLKPGNVIIRADGQSLVGLSSEEAVNLLRGLEGSAVKIGVIQGEETWELTVIRRAIISPTVTGEVLSGHIGYLDLNSFGSDTTKEFEMIVNQLRSEKVNGWIVDLRDNGGGYLSSALDLAGYFIGSEVSVQIKDRTGEFSQFKVSDPDLRFTQPVIFLTNENSASASEILAAAVKDHQKASLVGTTTYGKGTVQSMFHLESGGVLKMTVDRFFSPLGHDINIVGVSPDVEIQQADSLKVAELMLNDTAVALELGRTDDYWEAWQELMGVASPSALPSGFNYPYYYPSYRMVSELWEIPLDKKFTVHFSGLVDWQSVDNTSIELINSETGERTLAAFEPLGPSDVQVIPQGALTPDTTYWLIIHPTIKGVSGQVLQEGGLAVAQTIQRDEDAVGTGTSRIQSFRINDLVRAGNLMNPRDLDYGLAIKDLGARP